MFLFLNQGHKEMKLVFDFDTFFLKKSTCVLGVPKNLHIHKKVNQHIDGHLLGHLLY